MWGLVEEVGVGAGALETDFVVGAVVDEEPVGFDVGVAIA